MIRFTKSLIICAGLFSPSLPSAYSQTIPGCYHAEYYSDSRAHCADLSSNDVIALGILQVIPNEATGRPKVVLVDDVHGRLELLLTRGLIQAIDESPMEVFEVEGSITNGQMTVKTLRPIE